jgi:hypothetical protein
MENSIEELNKLEEQILQTQKLLEKTEVKDSVVSKLKTQRNIFAFLTLLFLAGTLFFYLNKNKSITDNIMDDNNVLLIDKDSLMIFKEAYLKNLMAKPNTEEEAKSLKNEKVIYSVQIGAFKDFQLLSDGLLNLSEYQADGYNKFSLGNYKTYAEAKYLKDSLIKLGFRGCFLTARSYGKSIGIREALALSNEPQFLEQ